jgi:hypothetical protein
MGVRALSVWLAPIRPTTASTAGALRVIQARTPRFVPWCLGVSGTYPHIPGSPFARVNAGLRQAIRDDEVQFASDPTVKRRVRCRYAALYATAIDRRLLSASTVVVSALLPATKLLPLSNGAQQWAAVTVRVPSGQRIRIADLFADPTDGLTTVAHAWTRSFKRAYPRSWWPCVTAFPEAYRPTTRNYRYFALTTKGLAIGFPNIAACGRFHATVSYSVLRPYLSRLGAELVVGVRASR